jgi:hypothetical protein
MIATDIEGSVRVEVWMRDHAPPVGDPRRTVLSRLRELEAAGVVNDIAVRIWGKSVPVSPDDTAAAASPVHDRITEFQRWAERNGHSLEPGFSRHEQSTLVSGESSEILRLPIRCLAVYEDDHLVGVFPCTVDRGTTTVADCLSRLHPDEHSDAGATE